MKLRYILYVYDATVKQLASDIQINIEQNRLEKIIAIKKIGENKSKIDLSLDSSSISVDNIGTDTVSSIVSACDTDVSHQSRTDDLDLAKNPKVVIELNSRRINYFSKLL